MLKLRVHSFAISIDGYGAGPSQDLEHPVGVNGEDLMQWFFHEKLPSRAWPVRWRDRTFAKVRIWLREQLVVALGADVSADNVSAVVTWL